MCEVSPGVALEKRIRHVEKRLEFCLSESSLKPSKILSVKELFASDDANTPKQGSLRLNKTAKAYCHSLFDLLELVGGKKVNNVDTYR